MPSRIFVVEILLCSVAPGHRDAQFTAFRRGCSRHHAGLLLWKSFCAASAPGTETHDSQPFAGDTAGIMPVCCYGNLSARLRPRAQRRTIHSLSPGIQPASCRFVVMEIFLRSFGPGHRDARFTAFRRECSRHHAGFLPAFPLLPQRTRPAFPALPGARWSGLRGWSPPPADRAAPAPAPPAGCRRG